MSMSMLTLMLTANREMCDASLIIQNASFTSYGTALKSYIHDLTPQELKSSRLQVNNLHHALCDVCWLFFCSIPFITFALLFSLHPSRNSDPGSHSTLFSPLPTTVCTVGALHFNRERTQALSSLVDSRRVVFVFISTSTSLPGINDNDAVKLEIGN